MRTILTVAALALASARNVRFPDSPPRVCRKKIDRNKPITLTGKLSKVEWVNPHTWFWIDVVEGGKTVAWHVEAGVPNQLMRRGWNRNSLKLGEVVKVEGFRHRGNEPIANGSTITNAAGKVFGAASSANNATN